MILIFSEKNDYSTYEVCKWLYFFNADFIRINKEDLVRLIELDIPHTKITIEVDGNQIDLNKITSIWYRRGFLNFSNFLLDEREPILDFKKDEISALNYYVFKRLLNDKNSLGNYILSFPNKLDVLELASKVGLIIPATFVSANKKKLLEYATAFPVITKGINASLIFKKKRFMYYGYTKEIHLNTLKKTSEYLFPSLIQKRIKKKYEVRTFFCGNKFYSMAIFSQTNSQTKTDFRNYDDLLPNRTVPYRLPKSVLMKIKKMVRKLKYISGSIDTLVDENNDHIFLEINPCGQFGMVSKPCNYQLEKIIAETLIANSN